MARRSKDSQIAGNARSGVAHQRMVRLRPTKGNLVVMVDLLCALIETGIMPSINSPLHHTARWLVDDSGHKPSRRRTRLKHRKPNNETHPTGDDGR